MLGQTEKTEMMACDIKWEILDKFLPEAQSKNHKEKMGKEASI